MLLLVTAGLLAADAATYRFLSSFLTDRVDQQLVAATREAVHVFSEPQFSPSGPQPSQGGALFPAGTYTALLDSEGQLVQDHVFGFSQDVPSPPDLPDGLPGSQTGPDAQETFTVEGESGDVDYRVLAIPLTDGTLVVAIPLSEVADTLGRLLVIEALVTVAVLVALAAVAWWLVRLGFRPLEQMGETAGAIAAGDLSRRVEPANTRTEVGRLGLALNGMLARIEEAFAERRASEERLRRFAADASHELRTPLTSVRGYAELFRRGAADDPAALRNAMRRIEEESARMGELVDELSLLARLDQRRPLDREPIDLVEVAEAAVDAARIADPSRPIDLGAPGPVVALADPVRIRQILDNLLSNAVMHTTPGSAIHVRVSGRDEDASLQVEDEGPGIPEEDTERVFERFYRADPSRSRESGGSGLGLSIVAALAEAHGGSATCTRAPGGGARFEVRIPRKAEEADPLQADVTPIAVAGESDT
jgi:two-component system OmpR family sensor kinase